MKFFCWNVVGLSEYLEVVMYLTRLYFLLALASLPTLSNAAFATVHDFGTLQKASSSISHDNIIETVNFDFTSVSFNQSKGTFTNGAVAGGGIELPNYDSNTQFRRGGRYGRADVGRIRLSDDEGGKNKYISIASPVPEPETYAMILAGLVLVGLTTRRRKHNS